MMTVDAENDDDALAKFMVSGKEHMAQAHADAPPMSDEEMENMVRTGMKKA